MQRGYGFVGEVEKIKSMIAHETALQKLSILGFSNAHANGILAFKRKIKADNAQK
jgi:hypothetical protein